MNRTSLQANIDKQARKLEEIRAQPHAPGPQGKAAKQKKIDKLDKTIKMQMAKDLGGVRMKQTFLVRTVILTQSAPAWCTYCHDPCKVSGQGSTPWCIAWGSGLKGSMCGKSRISGTLSLCTETDAAVQTAGVLLVLFRMTGKW